MATSVDATIKTGTNTSISLFGSNERAFRAVKRAAVGVRQAGAFRVMQTAD